MKLIPLLCFFKILFLRFILHHLPSLCALAGICHCTCIDSYFPNPLVSVIAGTPAVDSMFHVLDNVSAHINSTCFLGLNLILSLLPISWMMEET